MTRPPALRPVVRPVLGVAIAAGVVLAGAGPAYALLLGPGPSLTLEPGAGRPGDPVTATAGGLDYGTSCAITWDGTPIEGSRCEATDSDSDSGTGTATAGFPVPKDATVGDHQVVLTVYPFEGSGSQSAGRVFSVLTLVPNLLGADPAEAATLLDDAGLRDCASARSPAYGVVGAQEPAPGRRAAGESCVSLTFQVVVPDLTGDTPDEAAQDLAAVGLLLGDVTGDGVVRDQSPAAGEVADVQTAVGVGLQVIPPITTTPPTATSPTTTPTTSPTPTTPTPTTTTTLPTPTVSPSPVAHPTGTGSGTGALPWVLAGVGAALLAAVQAARTVRRRRLRGTRLRVRPYPDTGSLPRMRGGPGPDLPSIGLEPHPDPALDPESVEVSP